VLDSGEFNDPPRKLAGPYRFSSRRRNQSLRARPSNAIIKPMLHPCRLPPALAPLVIWSASLLAAAEPEKNEASRRRWDAGPLEAADYRAVPPQPLPFQNGTRILAFTVTEVRYSFKYRYVSRQGRFTATLESADVYGEIDRDQSWNAAAANASLLDHEQGHADITAIYAGRGRQTAARFLAAGLHGNGRDEASAREDLEQKLRKALQGLIDEWREEQQRYDRVTLHGKDARAQAEERRKHAELLRVLELETQRRC
jgi:hypothetical protein